MMNKHLTMITVLIVILIGTVAMVYAESADNYAHTYYLPYFTEGGNNWTGLGLRNSDSAESANISVIVYDQKGNPGNPVNRELPPRGQDAFVVGDGTGSEGWIRVNSDKPLTGCCFFGITGDQSYMADITLIPELSTKLYVPHIGQNYQWDSSIMICNPNETGTTVTLIFTDKDGNALSPKQYLIPAKGSAVCQVADLVQGGEYVNGSVEISSDQGVAAFALYNDLKNGGRSFAGISASEMRIRLEYAYYFPYFTEGGNEWTGVGLRNCSDENANISLFVYDQSGNALEPENRTLPPRGQDAFVVGKGGTGKGWIQVNSDQPLTGCCFFGMTGNDSYMADITFIPDSSTLLHVPHIGQNAQWDSEIMVCNPGTSAATVNLTFVKKDGNALSPKQYSISANGSAVCQVADLVQGGEYVNGSVEISSDQGVAAFALYNDLKNNGRSFAGISAVAPESDENRKFKTGNQEFNLEEAETSDPLMNFRSASLMNDLLPSRTDHSDLMPYIRDQGNTGSCTAWATAYYYKTWQEAMEEGWDRQQNAFSPMYLYSMQCRYYESPWNFIRSWEILNRYGCSKWDSMPFEEFGGGYEKSSYANVSIPNSAHEEAKEYRCGEKNQLASLGQVKQALTAGPVLLGINRYSDNVMYGGWKPSPENNHLTYDPYNSNVGHAILCVGYDDSKFGGGGLKFVNSWGQHWAIDGYSWIRYSDFSDIVIFAMTVKDIPNANRSDNTRNRPASPGNVRASDDTGPYVDITWDKVGAAQYYRIYRAKVSDPATYGEIGTGHSTSYRDYPEPGILYYYSVVSFNDIGNSDHFASDTDTKSYADKGSARGKSMNRPELRWTRNDDGEAKSRFKVLNIDAAAEAMEIFVSSNSDGPWYSFGWIEPVDFDIAWGDDSEYVGKKPFVKVTVSSRDGYSEASDPEQVGDTITSSVNVAAVLEFSAREVGDAVLLAWRTDNMNAEFFEVWRWLAAEDEGNEWILIDYTDADESYENQYADSTALPGKEYFYAVCAVYQGTYSEYAITDETVKISMGQANLKLYEAQYDYGQLGNPAEFDITVWNEGGTTIQDYTIAIWVYDWDTDEIFQISSVFNASEVNWSGDLLPLSPGYRHTLSFTLNIPSDYANGHYYSWGMEIDVNDSISEMYEDDNLLWSDDYWYAPSGTLARESASPNSKLNSKVGSTRPFSKKQAGGDAFRRKAKHFGPIPYKKPSFCVNHGK